MYTYALRCIEADYPTLVANAKVLGALPESYSGTEYYEDGHVVWDYIGFKKKDDGTFANDGQGNNYIHINARIPFNVRERAMELAASNPAIAAGLANVNKFFITDGEGNYVWPAEPVRAFL